MILDIAFDMPVWQRWQLQLMTINFFFNVFTHCMQSLLLLLLYDGALFASTFKLAWHSYEQVKISDNTHTRVNVCTFNEFNTLMNPIVQLSFFDFLFRICVWLKWEYWDRFEKCVFSLKIKQSSKFKKREVKWIDI